MIKILFLIIKAHLRKVWKGIYSNRYFHNVDFFNKNHIDIDKSVNIEEGVRIWAISPSNQLNIKIADNCWIGRDVEIQTRYESEIILEENVSIQDRCKILGSVYIGQDTLLAPDVFLSSGNHRYIDKPSLLIKEQDRLFTNDKIGFEKSDKAIFIGEDCWIGKNVILKNGVHIGRGAVIAANSFVNKNVPPYEVFGGSPAKFLKKRLNFDPPNSLDSTNISHYPYFYYGFDHRNIINGFLSKNTSFCVLKQKLKTEFIIFFGEIKTSGNLLIWYGNSIIYNKHLLKGIINETIPNKTVSTKIEIPQIIRNLKKYLDIYDTVAFEFLPDNKAIKRSFLINKLSIE